MFSSMQDSTNAPDAVMPGEHHYNRVILPQIVITQRLGK
jgi:hypothetical protein